MIVGGFADAIGRSAAGAQHAPDDSGIYFFGEGEVCDCGAGRVVGEDAAVTSDDGRGRRHR